MISFDALFKCSHRETSQKCIFGSTHEKHLKNYLFCLNQNMHQTGICRYVMAVNIITSNNRFSQQLCFCFLFLLGMARESCFYVSYQHIIAFLLQSPLICSHYRNYGMTKIHKLVMYINDQISSLARCFNFVIGFCSVEINVLYFSLIIC